MDNTRGVTVHISYDTAIEPSSLDNAGWMLPVPQLKPRAKNEAGSLFFW